jgi:antirestriction protein ArdC
MSKTKHRLSDEEPAERRARDREFAEQAVEALRTSEGWHRWLAARGAFHRYSLANSILIAMQRSDATLVAGFKRWLSLGYCVRKGEKAIRIWQPVPPSSRQMRAWRDAGADPAEKPRTYFKLGPVFAQSQVDPLPQPAQPAPLEPPIRPIAGDELLPAWPGLVTLAAEIGSTVTLTRLDGDGRYIHATRAIEIDDMLSGNQRVLALAHELAHALVRADRQEDDPKLGYAGEEWVAECVAFVTCRALGVDTSANSVPYLASYLEHAPADTLRATAGLIDRLARRIEMTADAALDDATDTQ